MPLEYYAPSVLYKQLELLFKSIKTVSDTSHCLGTKEITCTAHASVSYGTPLILKQSRYNVRPYDSAVYICAGVGVGVEITMSNL